MQKETIVRFTSASLAEIRKLGHAKYWQDRGPLELCTLLEREETESAFLKGVLQIFNQIKYAYTL